VITGWALAAEPASEEITVYAEERVHMAREAVVRELEALGFVHAEKVGDREVFRHTEPWKGEVVLHDEGFTLVRRQPIRVEGRRMPWTQANTPVAWAGCFVYPWLCVRVGGALIGTAKWRAQEGRTVDRVAPIASEWSARIADLHTQRKVADLPARLEALWSTGAPLDGGPPLATFEARRAALFDFWDSRTETPWGEEVRGAIEAFCRAVVQTSEHPFTAEELDAYDRRRTASERFDPERRRATW
jgi:hypothetical protein